MEEAIKLDFDWLLISDDDAYSQEDAFEILKKIISIDENDKVRIIFSSVIEYGIYSRVHRSIKSKKAFVLFYPSIIKDYQKKNLKLIFFHM